MSSDDFVDINEKINILSMEDEKIKQVGELLSNDASRKILKILFKKSHSANEIAKETEISLPLVMYHLKKMQEANMVSVTNVGKTLESKDVKRYTTTKFAILIVADSVQEKVKESKSLKRTFSGFYRFASITVVAASAWFVSQFAQESERATTIPIEQPDGVPVDDSLFDDGTGEVSMGEAPMEDFPPEGAEVPIEDIPREEITEPITIPEVPDDTAFGIPINILVSAVITLGVIVVGLVIERIVRSRQKN